MFGPQSLDCPDFFGADMVGRDGLRHDTVVHALTNTNTGTQHVDDV